MGAPEYVPTDPVAVVRSYRSPRHVPDGWTAERPSDVTDEQPSGGELGHQGPDQGYAIKLANRFADRLVLGPGEQPDDVLAGAVAIATKRASLFGRAPVIHDVEVALRAFGFLDDAPDELRALRRARFEGVASPHHYSEARRLAALVPESTLRMTPAAVEAAHRADWSTLLALPA